MISHLPKTVIEYELINYLPRFIKSLHNCTFNQLALKNLSVVSFVLYRYSISRLGPIRVSLVSTWVVNIVAVNLISVFLKKTLPP